MTTSDAGRKGGSVVRDKYGEDYYRTIGKKGGIKLKETRGAQYYRDIAHKGGTANMAKYGPEHFSDSDFYSVTRSSTSRNAFNLSVPVPWFCFWDCLPPI